MPDVRRDDIEPYVDVVARTSLSFTMNVAAQQLDPWTPVKIKGEFRSPFTWTDKHPTTLIERRMRWLSGSIREKPTWWEKVADEDVVAKWRREAIEQDAAMVEKLWGGEERYKRPDHHSPTGLRF